MGRVETESFYILNVTQCPRCSSDHNDIPYYEIDNHNRYTHWCICPVKNQPILVWLWEEIDNLSH
jgi:hypothetical protein